MESSKLTSTKAHAHEARSSGTYRVSIRKVLTRPDARLSLPAVDVDPVHPYVVALADALVATMRVSPACVGLAATQVGEPARIFCIDVTGHKRAQSCAGLVVMCNPTVVWRSSDVVLREGCMSVPDLTGDVARATRLTVTGLDVDGGRRTMEVDAFEARAVLHEIDHLDGLVFLDRVVGPHAVFARKSYR